MKAISYEKFGSPEVLKVVEIPIPEPKEDEVLIKIHATTVEKEDPQMRKHPGINGILKPKHNILGMEFSGEVVKVGGKVTEYKQGDMVFGNAGTKYGTYAEYICVKVAEGLSFKPNNLTHSEAVALTNGALTALPFLRDGADIKKGDKILINGASGTVGSAAVQIAKYYGAYVIGVCSEKNIEKVRAFGADEVYDYNKTDVSKLHESFDIIFDVAGKLSYGKMKHRLKERGVYLATMPNSSIFLKSFIGKKFGAKGKKVCFMATGLRKLVEKSKDLNLIKQIAEEGMLKPNIDKVFSLEDMIKAHYYAESGKNGTIVITP